MSQKGEGRCIVVQSLIQNRIIARLRSGFRTICTPSIELQSLLIPMLVLLRNMQQSLHAGYLQYTCPGLKRTRPDDRSHALFAVMLALTCRACLISNALCQITSLESFGAILTMIGYEWYGRRVK